MDIAAVKNHIKQVTPSPLYLFTGTEIAIQNIYIKKLAECKNLEIVRVDSISDIFGKLNNNSFIKKNYCYVIRDDKEFMVNEKIWDSIQSVIGNNILIFLFTSLDKRSKFFKRYKDSLVEFEPLKPQILKKYIQREINLSDKYCDKLIEICESDYSRILLEIDKIKSYVAGLNIDIDKNSYDYGFCGLLEQGIIYQPPKDAIFDFIDAVLRRKPRTSFDLLEQSYAVGEAPMVLLSVLYTNVKQLLQVQSCQSKDISKSTGLTGWQIKCVKDKCGIYSNGELVRMLRLIRETEKGIKIGLIEDSLAVEQLLVQIF